MDGFGEKERGKFFEANHLKCKEEEEEESYEFSRWKMTPITNYSMERENKSFSFVDLINILNNVRFRSILTKFCFQDTFQVESRKCPYT